MTGEAADKEKHIVIYENDVRIKEDIDDGMMALNDFQSKGLFNKKLMQLKMIIKMETVGIPLTPLKFTLTLIVECRILQVESPHVFSLKIIVVLYVT